MMLKFYSLPGCPPCQLVEDCLDELDVKYEKIDVRGLGRSFKSLPLLITKVNGVDVEKTGYRSDEDFKAWLKSTKVIS